MADSNSQPPKCPCGFWGSAQTQGLCSKCYRDRQTKGKSEIKEPSSGASAFLASSIGDHASRVVEQPTASSACSNPLSHSSSDSEKRDKTDTATDKQTDLTVDKQTNVDNTDRTDVDSKPADVDSKSTESDVDTTAADVDCRATDVDFKPSEDGESAAGSGADTVTAGSSEGSPGSADKESRKRQGSALEDSPEKPVQKNKKRCFKCNTKLELALREIGKCRCGLVFCNLHRLPEEHDCRFDHKETGRKEAMEKIVKPKRHLGTSFKRLDST